MDWNDRIGWIEAKDGMDRRKRWMGMDGWDGKKERM